MRVTYIERAPGTWRLRIETGIDDAGRRRFKYETLKGTEDDAARRRFTILNAHDENSFAAPDGVRFGQFFAHWVETRQTLGNISRSTAVNYIKIYNYYLKQSLGGRKVQKITSQDITRLYAALIGRGDLSPQTILHVRKIMNACFRAARRTRLITVNIMDEVEAPLRRGRHVPKALRPETAVALLDAAHGTWMHPILALALTTGLRRGEVLGLRWGDVELDAARLHVRGQLVQYDNGDVVWQAPKTEAGVRTVTLPGETVELLRGLRVAAAERRLLTGAGGSQFEQAYVFTRWRDVDSPVAPQTLTACIRRFCDANGFERQLPRVILSDDYGDDDEKRGA